MRFYHSSANFASNHHHAIRQFSDPADLDHNGVAGLQREVVWRHDPRSRQQDRAIRKFLTAEEKLSQFLERTLDLAHTRFASEYRCTRAANFNRNLPRPRFGFTFTDSDARPHGT